MSQRRRLNLFAFTPETDALFGMLMIASIWLALFLGPAFALLFGFDNPLSNISVTTRGLEVTRAYLPIICFSSIAVSAVLVVACILYFRHPYEIRRRRKIGSISEKDQEIQDQVSKLAIHSGVEPPKIEMPPQGLRGTDAQAFGVGKMRRVALDGGLRILRKTKPHIFNAILRHELAHFANQDIGKSYFSDALWKSIRWVIILPFVLGLLGYIILAIYLGVLYGDLLQRFTGPIQSFFWLIVQFGFVLLVAGLMWVRLIRTREFYADWRAVLWGAQSGLNIIFQEEVEKEKPKPRFNVFQFHPDGKERLVAIEHPEELFKYSPMMIFMAGLLLASLFIGLYFSLAAFLTFAGVMQAIRDASTGWAYWLARGVFWLGIAALIFFAFGLTGWLINGVLLPQIQKQVVLELINRQRGWIQYIKMLMIAVILVAGIELGFFMSPFSVFAPIGLWEIVLEIFIIAPILVLIAWLYLAYLRFISLRLTATQVGKNYSVWRKRFMQAASALWVFLFFVPGLFLSRFLSGELLEVFMYASLIWLASTLLLGSLAFAGSWAVIKLSFDNQPRKCPHCGKITEHAAPAIEQCEHCEGVLGEWLFVEEKG
jgi:Zn-dependent protease with chaperone function